MSEQPLPGQTGQQPQIIPSKFPFSQTIVQNGQSFTFEGPTNESVLAAKQRALDDTAKDLPELFNEGMPTLNSLWAQNIVRPTMQPGVSMLKPTGGSPTGLVTPQQAAEVGAGMGLSSTPNDQLAVVKKTFPQLTENDFQFSDDGQLIVTVRDPTDPNRFDRGYVNKSGPSTADVKQTASVLAQFLPAANAAKVVNFGSRFFMNTAVRSIVSGGAAASTEVARQKALDFYTKDNIKDVEGLPDEEAQRWSNVALVGVSGMAGELIGPALDMFARWGRNKTYIDGGQLKPAAEAALKKMGIDPELIKGDANFIKEFSKATGWLNKPLRDAMVRTNPDLAARLAADNTGINVTVAGGTVKQMLDEKSARVAEANSAITDAVASTGSIKASLKYKHVTAGLSSITKDVADAGLADDASVIKHIDDLSKVLYGGTPSSSVVLGKVVTAKADKTVAQTLGDYTTVWRRNVLKGIANAQPGSSTQKGLQVLLDSADVSVKQAVLDSLARIKDPEQLKNVSNALHLDKQFTDTFTSADMLDNIFNTGKTPEEAMRTIFGASDLVSQGKSVDVLNKIKQVWGEDSNTWRAMKAEALRVMLNQGGREFSGKALMQSYRNSVTNNPTITNLMFTPADHKIITDLINTSQPKMNVSTLVASALRVMYGVGGQAEVGAMNRLGLLDPKLINARSRPMANNLIVDILTGNASQNTTMADMYTAAPHILDNTKKAIHALGTSVQEKTQEDKTQRVVPKSKTTSWTSP